MSRSSEVRAVYGTATNTYAPPPPTKFDPNFILGNSVVTDVHFGHLFLVCIKYDALQEVTCGLFRKISHCS